MKKPNLKKFALAGLNLSALLLQVGCTAVEGVKSSLASGSASLTLAHTSPAADVTMSSATPLYQWSPSSTPRSTHPYQVKVYAQANCSGTAVSTQFVEVPQFASSGLIDSATQSIGVTGFDASGVSSSEACSHNVLGSAYVSKLQVPGGVYLSLDVDYVNKMAYMGANYGTTFFDAIDLSDEKNPSLFRTIGAGSTPSTAATYSRGAALYNNGQRLLISSNGANSLELWDFTGNPRTGSWTRLANLTGISYARKIVKVDTSNPTQTVVYLAQRDGYTVVNIAEPAGTMTVADSAVTVRAWAGVIIGNWMMLPGNISDVASLFDLTAKTQTTSYGFNASSVLWAASATADSKKIFTGGCDGAFYSYNTATPAVVPVINYRFHNSAYVIRDSMFVLEGTKDVLYNSRQGQVDVWDVTSTSLPILMKSLILDLAAGEAYGIRVNPTAHRAYVSTTGGWLYIINTDMISPSAGTPAAY